MREWLESDREWLSGQAPGKYKCTAQRTGLTSSTSILLVRAMGTYLFILPATLASNIRYRTDRFGNITLTYI